MSETYTHAQLSDRRYQVALETCQRSGSAFDGGDAFLSDKRNTLNWGLVLICVAIVGGAKALGLI